MNDNPNVNGSGVETHVMTEAEVRQAANKNDPVVFLNGWVYAALSCTVRGAVASLPGYQPRAVVIACCRMMGALVGHLLAGSIADVLMIRKQCREAFIEALQKSPSPPSAGLVQPQPPHHR